MNLMQLSANLFTSSNAVHTNMSNRNIADPMRERCREIWWTIYILDSHMAALMGVPQSLSEHDVTAQLPEFAAHTSKSLALGIHVKLARATSSILQSECWPLSISVSRDILTSMASVRLAGQVLLLTKKHSDIRQRWPRTKQVPPQHQRCPE